jgi:hypothetical protein
MRASESFASFSPSRGLATICTTAPREASRLSRVWLQYAGLESLCQCPPVVAINSCVGRANLWPSFIPKGMETVLGDAREASHGRPAWLSPVSRATSIKTWRITRWEGLVGPHPTMVEGCASIPVWQVAVQRSIQQMLAYAVQLQLQDPGSFARYAK